MKRRQFIRSTISTGLLALGGVSAFQFYQQSQLKYNETIKFNNLSQDDDVLLDLLIPIFIFGTTNKDIKESIPLQQIKGNIDVTIALQSKATQKELRELLDLLASGFGRLVIAGVWLNWQSASDESLNEFISDWRESAVELLQVGYKGLHKIILGSSYVEKELWDAIGYPGPPAI